jgi:alpha-1,6-mannosyltransferase
VASGVFRPELRSPELRKRLETRAGAPEGSTLVLYAGRLAPEKNLHLLVETMVLLEEAAPGAFHLLVAGEGSLRVGLERECSRRIPGAACFLGHIAGRNALAEIYANTDIFIHPNPREPFGIAPLEAMAAGLALVAPNTGGVRHYADGSNAWLAEPTPQAFAAAVQAIRNHPADCSARRRAARSTAERFDWETVTAGYFDLYEELYSLVRDNRHVPSLTPAFYSTAERGATMEATG